MKLRVISLGEVVLQRPELLSGGMCITEQCTAPENEQKDSKAMAPWNAKGSCAQLHLPFK